MAKPQVTLTFAGDESKLTKSFDKIGQAARTMDTDVGVASKSVGDGFDRAGAASDETYSKFDALESVGRGTTDTMSGLGEIMKGNVLQGSTDLAGGVAALADGFSGALLPAIRGMTKASLGNAVQNVRTTATTYAHRGATLAGAAAARVMTVAQRGLNLAMRANPIGLIITLLFAVGAALILAYKRSSTFRAVVNSALNSVRGVLRAVVVSAQAVYSWVRTNAPKIGGFFRGVANSISAPFRLAFSGIRSAWNNTVGGKGFSIPGWVPNLGGREFRIPYFHSGGIVPGGVGSETLSVLRAGERVTAGSNNGGGSTITIRADGQYAKQMLQMLKGQIRVEGGAKVVFAL